MWADYTNLNPQAERIYKLLTSNGETVLNDHIALRTFNHPRLGGIAAMAKHFIALGYEEKNDYIFPDYIFPNKKNFFLYTFFTYNLYLIG